jgi:hypothetical protein
VAAELFVKGNTMAAGALCSALTFIACLAFYVNADSLADETANMIFMILNLLCATWQQSLFNREASASRKGAGVL